jgi:redox-sensitive bicupin YhaK (pirin superfamily)
VITVRPAGERGHFDRGWLDTWHTFSFDAYHDDRFLGFRSLRVINDDRIAPASEFGMHPHRDMEIVTYVLEGELEHKDSMGNGSVIRPGEVQRMSAGTGVLHSERNPSRAVSTRLLQIWILPDRRGHEPGYEQKRFPEAERRGRLRLVASPDGDEGSVSLHQDARILATLLAPGETASHRLQPGRGAWVQVARGAVTLQAAGAAAGAAAGRGGGEPGGGRLVRLSAGDGAAVEDEAGIALTGVTPAEVLVFDLK